METPPRRLRRTARLEFVLDYIDAHLGESLDIEMLAGLATLSPFHFHRVFSSHVGESVSAYVRRRNLERAARCLLREGASVTTCGSLAGYASTSAFTRAFRQQFGMAPRDMSERHRRRTAAFVAALPAGPHYRTVPSMTVFAVRRFGPYATAYREAWACLHGVIQSAGGEPTVGLGILPDCSDLTPEALRRYEACSIVMMPTNGLGFPKRIVGGDYAVFDFRGHVAELQTTHDAVRWAWSPPPGIKFRDLPSFHVFPQAPTMSWDGTEVVAEIMVPIESSVSQKLPFPPYWRASLSPLGELNHTNLHGSGKSEQELDRRPVCRDPMMSPRPEQPPW